MEDCRVVELRHAASLQNSPANSTKGRFRRLRAKAQAENSIAVKEDLFNFSFLEVGYSVTELHGEPGTRRRGLQQTGVLMDEERKRYRNTGKDINISVDIYNNRQETRGRTDY